MKMIDDISEKIIQEYSGRLVVLRDTQVGSFNVDFAIIDSKTNSVLAVFILKEQDRFSQSQLSGFNSFITRLRREADESISVYYILYDDKEYVISHLIRNDEFRDQNKFKFQEVDLPSGNQLLQLMKSSHSPQMIRLEQKKNINKLKWIGSSAAVALIVIYHQAIFLDETIEQPEVWLLALIVGLFLLPYISKIAIGGFEMQLLEEENKKNSECS